MKHKKLEVAPLSHFFDGREPSHNGIGMEYSRLSIHCEMEREAEGNYRRCINALVELTSFEDWMLFGLLDDGTTMFENDGGRLYSYFTRG